MSEVHNSPIILLGSIPVMKQNGSIGQVFMTARKIDSFMTEIMITTIHAPTARRPWINVTHQPFGCIDTLLFFQLLGFEQPRTAAPQNSTPFRNESRQTPSYANERAAAAAAPKEPELTEAEKAKKAEAAKKAEEAKKAREAEKAKEAKELAEAFEFLNAKRKEVKRDVATVNKDSTPHQILGVAANAEASEIKKAYRKLSVLIHPDKNDHQKKALDAFRMLDEAFKKLIPPKAQRPEQVG